MAFLFGWQAADLGATTVASITGANNVKSYDEDGGFVVPADCTVERVFVDTTNADSRPFRIYIVDYDTGDLLAASAEAYSDADGLFVDIPPLALTAGRKVSLQFHSNTFVSANRESTAYRYFRNIDRLYEDGPLDPFTGWATGNTGRVEIWADGTLGGVPTVTVSGDLQPGASFTLNYSNYGAVPVSPVTITDSNSNSITVPVTINDNGDGTGTATGTYPALPSSGTATGLLFGSVTVELNT